MRRFKEFLRQPQYYPGFVGFRGWPGLIGESVRFPVDHDFHEGEAPGHSAMLEHYQHFDSDDAKHFHKYTKASRGLNEALHTLGSRKFDYEADQHMKRNAAFHAGLSKALKKHTTPHAMHVWSGSWFNPGRVKARTADGKIPIHLHSYTSTSLSRHVGGGHAKGHDEDNGERHHHYLQIHVPKGSHGGYIQHLSVHPHEYEFLLHHGAKLHIDPTPRTEHVEGESRKMWRAKLVHDGVHQPPTIEGTAK